MTVRTDNYRPSEIEPADCEFVAIEYMKMEAMEACIFLQEQRRIISEHMKRTGGTYARHQHGGNCHVCGAAAIYTALFYHRGNNEYFRTGFDCAEKMHMGDARLFRDARTAVKGYNELKAGIRKATLRFEEIGCPEAIDLWNASPHRCDTWDRLAEYGLWEEGKDIPWCYLTLRDIVDKQVRYGQLSEKQEAFLVNLTQQCLNYKQVEAEREAKRQAEREAAEDVPEYDERIRVVGEILSVRYNEEWDNYKMLVKEERGFKLWGSLPKGVDPDEAKGGKIEFDARVERSDKDSQFGFFKRPTKVEFTKE